MLLTIEKVIILKSVSIFSDIAERGLVEAATVLEEIRAEPGQKIFEKGDTGNSLYIVVEGSVSNVIGLPAESLERALAWAGELEKFSGNTNSRSNEPPI